VSKPLVKRKEQTEDALGTCPRDDRAEVWRVELAGGRVVLFTTRKQFE
jgi:hypothetical protein